MDEAHPREKAIRNLVKEIDQLLFHMNDVGLASVPDETLLEIRDAMTTLKKVAPDLFPEEMEY